MGIHVLPGANYAGFHTNQTLCQVISVISTSSLVESNQWNYLEKRFIYFKKYIICNHDPMCKAKISRNCHYHHPHIPFHQNSFVPLSAHVGRSSWRSSRKGFLSPGGKITSDFMLTFHMLIDLPDHGGLFHRLQILDCIYILSYSYRNSFKFWGKIPIHFPRVTWDQYQI